MNWLFPLFLLSFFPLYGGFDALHLTADSAVLINADSGAVLYEKEADKSQHPASTTKIATALYALYIRGDKLDDLVTAELSALGSVTVKELERSNYTLPSHYMVRGLTHMGIKKGEVLSLETLLYGLMISSAGDAANVIAQYLGGTIPHFISELNFYLKEIGCEHTHFTNVHGYYHPKHLTTARDLALMTKEGLKNPTFRKIVRTVRHPRPRTNLQESSVLFQGNRLLRKGKYYYPKAIGVKSGYTDKSRHTLVAAAESGERTLIAVLLKGEKGVLYQEARRLFECAFRESKVTKRLLKQGKQKVALSFQETKKKLVPYTKKDILWAHYPSEQPQLTSSVFWENTALPISKGDQVGYIEVLDRKTGKKIREPLYASDDVYPSWGERFTSALKSWM